VSLPGSKLHLTSLTGTGDVSCRGHPACFSDMSCPCVPVRGIVLECKFSHISLQDEVEGKGYLSLHWAAAIHQSPANTSHCHIHHPFSFHSKPLYQETTEAPGHWEIVGPKCKYRPSGLSNPFSFQCAVLLLNFLSPLFSGMWSLLHFHPHCPIIPLCSPLWKSIWSSSFWTFLALSYFCAHESPFHEMPFSFLSV
jgi:hypothetical protein